MPPGDGVENSLITSISSFTPFTPTIPWYQGGTWCQFSFPAPKLYGSPELGVRGSPVLEALRGQKKEEKLKLFGFKTQLTETR